MFVVRPLWGIGRRPGSGDRLERPGGERRGDPGSPVGAGLEGPGHRPGVRSPPPTTSPGKATPRRRPAEWRPSRALPTGSSARSGGGPGRCRAPAGGLRPRPADPGPPVPASTAGTQQGDGDGRAAQARRGHADGRLLRVAGGGQVRDGSLRGGRITPPVARILERVPPLEVECLQGPRAVGTGRRERGVRRCGIGGSWIRDGDDHVRRVCGLIDRSAHTASPQGPGRPGCGGDVCRRSAGRAPARGRGRLERRRPEPGSACPAGRAPGRRRWCGLHRGTLSTLVAWRTSPERKDGRGGSIPTGGERNRRRGPGARGEIIGDPASTPDRDPLVLPRLPAWGRPSLCQAGDLAR